MNVRDLLANTLATVDDDDRPPPRKTNARQPLDLDGPLVITHPGKRKAVRADPSRNDDAKD